MAPLSEPAAPAPGDAPLRILCVHGVGHQEADPQFAPAWRRAIVTGLRAAGCGDEPRIEFVHYDALFAAAPRDLAVWRRGFLRLLSSGWNAAVGRVQDWLGGWLGRGVDPAPPGRRGLGDWLTGVREDLQWTAGMVAQWAADDALRAAARAQLRADLERFQPQVILAHSLGSLIAYDTFARPGEPGARAVEGRWFVSFGSQINNPFVRDRFGGRLGPLPARHWFHLFNRHDDAFTAPIRLPLPRFTQVLTTFDLAGMLDHDAAAYLTHPEMARVVWRACLTPSAAPLTVAVAASRAAAPAAGAGEGAPAPRSLREAVAFTLGRSRRTVARRALLVGINEYPQPEMCLEGCVNDVYRMSETLQALGFTPENIRIVLNARATAAAIRERLEWLLDGCQDEQDRVFFYSGHGAQLPGYGYEETVDRADECLVPYDFDWTPERAVVDNWFYELYSQLPPRARMLVLFDCCHSGGMARDGRARVRGLSPPDDIRHRVLAWDPVSESWTPRTESAPGAAHGAAAPVRLRRMFRGARQLVEGRKTSWDDPTPFGHAGPFFPVILEACREDQLAYEHRDGATPYGAFTWCVSRVLGRRRRPATWGALIRAAARQLAALGYAQTPLLEGPPGVAERAIPWTGAPVGS
jgi:hypothetical protein